MKRRYSLGNNKIQKLIETGKFIKAQNSVIYFEKTLSFSGGFAVAVSKKIKPIVKKNKIRRQVQNIMRKLKPYWINYNIIVITKKNYLESTFQEIIHKVLQKIETFKS